MNLDSGLYISFSPSLSFDKLTMTNYNIAVEVEYDLEHIFLRTLIVLSVAAVEL